MMKIRKLFKKAVALVLAAAAVFIAGEGLTSQKVEAASVRIFFDENACAYIYEDGSGYIECYKEFTKDEPLTEINGVALKDIITFNDGGYVDTYYDSYEVRQINQNVVVYSPHTIYVHGCGPEGLFSGYGYLHFTDQKGTYDISLWSHSLDWTTLEYQTDIGNMINKISWNS